MKVAITGEVGFLGYHLTQYLKYQLKYEIISLGRGYQDNIDLVKGCDCIFHCAGVNRNLSDTNNNSELAIELVTLLESHNIKIDIMFASSIQEFHNTDYGLDKIRSNKILSEYCQRVNKKFISYKLPNLFGPFGKPNYNSVVATFCYNLVNGIECQINDARVDLCYVYDAIQSMLSDDAYTNYSTTNISIKELYLKLNEYHSHYSNGIIPKLSCKFDIDLFNTYRSFANNVHEFIRHTDDRGYLLELLKSYSSESQVFFSTTKPNVTRGNHFHFNKVERFCVLKGSANISIRKLGTSEIISYNITDDMNVVVDMPILYSHNITNIGDCDLICLFWTNEIFDKENPDTFFEKV
jgi:UDP-2-acetamido-2,6-beta-L-arabino-hexul-4-ose reductase